METEAPLANSPKIFEKNGEPEVEEDELSPIEEVRLTVPTTDDPELPVWTFRMWVLGIFSCVLLSFLNQFFSYRKEPLVISQITVIVASLPIGRFMATVLPTKGWMVSVPGFGPKEFTLNPGPFNIKEHVLISIFANAGSAFGNGPAYAVMIVDIIIAFYRRKISFLAGWLLVITTQVLFDFFVIVFQFSPLLSIDSNVYFLNSRIVSVYFGSLSKEMIWDFSDLD